MAGAFDHLVKPSGVNRALDVQAAQAAVAGLDVSGDTVKPTAMDSTCFESRHVSGHFERRRRQSDRAAAKGGRTPQKSGRKRLRPTAAGRGR